MKKFSLILCSVPDIMCGRRIARALLEKKLAACVSISPKMESHFTWKGKVERVNEMMLLIKTSAQFYPKIEKMVLIMHPYECPEILQIPINKGFRKYLTWIVKETL